MKIIYETCSLFMEQNTITLQSVNSWHKHMQYMNVFDLQ